MISTNTFSPTKYEKGKGDHKMNLEA